MKYSEIIEALEAYKDFFANLQAKNIMSTDPITLNEEGTIKEAQVLMRDKKISGIPIVDESGVLISIITMEDLVKALEEGYLDKQITSLKRKRVIALQEDDDFEKVIQNISEYGYGRFPVVTKENKLCGIITKQDLLFSVISKLSVLYLHDERRKQVLDTPLSIIVKDNIDKNSPDFIYDIKNHDVNNAGEGSAMLKSFLNKKGFSKKLIRKISIATYEAEVNVVIHGGGIGKIFAITTDDAINVYVEDIGPGIENVERSLQPGYSTASEDIRALGFGAGMGLPNIKRFADKLLISSEKNKGVKLEMVFWLDENS